MRYNAAWTSFLPPTSDTMNAESSSYRGSDDSRPTLLLADDDPIVRSAFSSQLGGDFNVIAAAHDAIQAIELAAEHQPDAALVDVEMPNGGARAAVPAIATRSPDTCIVILSGDESSQMVIELLEAGAIAYVRKGVSGAQIATTLADALRVKAGGSRP